MQSTIKMEGEIENFIKLWIIAITSAYYSYFLSKIIPSGIPRLILILPIISLFTTLPFSLHSFHLGTTSFAILAWLATFKLVLFSAGLGPLSAPLSPLGFTCVLLLPIKLRPTKSQTPGVDQSENAAGFSSKVWRSAPFVAKCLALGCIAELYNYRRVLPHYVVLCLYCCQLYLNLDIIIVVCGALARTVTGLDLAPHFNQPYMTTSLQDFWGNRWNLIVSDILRVTIHDPVRSIASPIVGKRQAILVGIFATFLVSGLMHELIHYHLTRVSPTWEVTQFFVLHGVCTVIEVIIKRQVSGSWRLHRAISAPLTFGFLLVTAVWLYAPQLLRNGVHERVINEYCILAGFLKRNVMYLLYGVNDLR